MAAQLERRRVSLVFLLCCLLAPLFNSAELRAESRARYGSRIEASLLEEPLVIDPLEAESATDMLLVSLLFDTLYRVQEGAVVPHLALALPDQSEPLVVRIPLRRGVRFHDGKPMTAADVVASLRRLRSSAQGFRLREVESIEAESDESGERVLLRLRSPMPGLARSLCELVSSVTWRGREPSWRRPVGTGAFRVDVRSASKRELLISAHERHFAGRPYVDVLRLRWFESKDEEARLFESGSSHISQRGAIAFAGHRPKYRSAELSSDANLLSFVGFGKKTGALLADRDFRRALSLAIGRDAMRFLGSGEKVRPTVEILPADRGKGARRLLPKLREARLLITALAKTHPQLRDRNFVLELVVNRSRPDDLDVAGKVAAALFDLGVQSKIVPLSAATFARRVDSGSTDLFIGQLVVQADRPRESLFLSWIAGGEEGQLGRLMDKGLSVIKRRFGQSLPLIPLFHRAIRLHHRHDLHGLRFGQNLEPDYENLFFFGTPERN